MRLAAVVAALLYALWQSLPKRLFWYLVWQLIYALTVFPVATFIPDTTWQYAIVFSVLTLPILWCVVELTLEAVKEHKAKWLALTTGVLAAWALAWLAYRGLPRPITYKHWIALSEGSVLSFAAVSAGLAIPYVSRARVLTVLSFLWLSQSLWRFGFQQHVHSDLWLRLNWEVPPILGVAAFLLIGRWAGVPPTQRQPHLR